MKVTAIIASAGQGRRMGTDRQKPYIGLGDRPILAYSLDALDKSHLIDEIVVVVGKPNLEMIWERIIKRYNIRKVKKIVVGGRTRSDSVYNGLRELDPHTDIVLIHDGARPFLRQDLIRRSIEAAKKFGAAVVAVRATSTIKEVDRNSVVSSTLNRKELWEVQTPQTFKKNLILKAYERAGLDRRKAKDDATLVEKMGGEVRVIRGFRDNIKITTPEDLMIAEAILKVYPVR